MLAVKAHRTTAIPLNIRITLVASDEYLLIVALASAALSGGNKMQKIALHLDELEFCSALSVIVATPIIGTVATFIFQ